jgi:Mg2+ and Co2+ transporter CorA
LLRLLRVVRLFAVTGRTLQWTASAPSVRQVEAAPLTELAVNIQEEGTVTRKATWQDAEASIRDPRETWIDVQGASRADLDAMSAILRIPKHVLESKLFRDVFPGVDYFKDYTILTVWDTRLVSPDDGSARLQTENPPVVLICAPDYLATVSTGRNCLFEHLVGPGLPLKQESFSVRVLYAILQHKIGDYKQVVRLLEHRVAELEELPPERTSRRFLDETFRLKRVIQQQDYNLRHFAQVLHHLQSRKVALRSIRDESLDLFILLHDEAATLNDTCHSIRENLLSLIELQLNNVSFDLNRTMRFLAVITSLAVIPAVIGGLLGENLVDQPFHVTLPEVSFLVISLMLIGLYVFHRIGWLK